MEETLKLVLRKTKKPISIDKIYSKVETQLNKEDESFQQLSESQKDEINYFLEKGISEYEVIKTDADNYIPLMKTSFRKGRFYCNRNGDGTVVVTTSYVDREGETIVNEERYHVDKGDSTGAIDGDVVLVDLRVKNKKGTVTGVVKKVIERNLNSIVGEVYRVGNSYFVKPIDKKKQGLTIALEGEAIEGQRVAVSLLQQTGNGFYVGDIQRTFNHKDDPDEDVLWEAFKCGIDDQFSKESLEQVEYIPSSVSESDKIGRMDLTNWEIFTIDGEDTKDIDDAISCRMLDNGNFLVGVHIADVSHYVPENSPLDKDAFKRGTSAYLVGKVIPMLPHELSNGICSLNPYVTRLALSCVMEVDSNGNVVNSNIWESVIQSRLKMSYTKVNAILKNGVIDSEYEEYSDTLKLMNKLALILRRKRIKEGAIEFDRPELKVELDDNGNVNGFSVRRQDLGENLIEEYMLLANETVDKTLCKIGAPCLHRIHDRPNIDRMEDFIRLLNAVGYVYKTDAVTCCNDKKALQDLSMYIRETGKLSSMLSTNMVRCMSRAKYSPNNIGHNGLAKDYYCHFTSPIRRYPDLTIHRLLKECYLDKENREKNSKKWIPKLPEIAANSSKMERVADEAEKQTMYMRTAEYMSKRVGQDFVGTVVGLSDRGIQVELDNYIEGRVRLRNLPGDYVYNPETYTLISLSGNTDYYVGDRLSLKVKDASKETKTIDFTVNEKIDENKMMDSYNSNYRVKVKVNNDRMNRAFCSKY